MDLNGTENGVNGTTIADLEDLEQKELIAFREKMERVS